MIRQRQHDHGVWSERSEAGGDAGCVPKARWQARVVAAAVLVTLAASACTSAETKKVVPSATPTPTSSLGVVVGHRAPAPTDLDAHGLTVEVGGSMPFTVGTNHFSISGQDWNTITGASDVAKTVPVTVDPEFHATATTVARFQYLADAMSKYMPATFGYSGIVVSPKGGDAVSIVGLLNPTAKDIQVSNLLQTVRQGPQNRVVARAVFYSAAGAAITVPAHGIYFAWLESRQISPVTRDGGDLHWEFQPYVKCTAGQC